MVRKGDKECLDLLQQMEDDLDTRVTIEELDEPEWEDDRTKPGRWTRERVSHMVDVRNALLQAVRRISPEYFLSLDSDVMLAEQGVGALVETIEIPHPRSMRGPMPRPYDAVGGKCYLSWPARNHPSYAMYTNQSLRRDDASGVMVVDLIFAIKLMRPSAYAVDYEFHLKGEDVGWGLACARRGVTLAWDGRVTNKHVMHPDSLDVVDPRVGF